MKNITRYVKGLFFYILGNIISIFIYDRKYLRGRYFKGKLGGVCSQGWKWVTYDGIAKLFTQNNRGVKWPISPKVTVMCPENINFSPNDLHIFHTYGTYFQAIDGKIVIGEGSWIAPNVGLITTNHDINNPDNHTEGKNIIIGKKCWIGMNSIILPGVELGDNTTVGAGSVVTKSFKDGRCVIAGNPAKVIKYIN